MDALTVQSRMGRSDTNQMGSDGLVSGLKQNLLSAKTKSDVDRWLGRVNLSLRDSSLPSQTISDLRRLRQSAYDRKRKLPQIETVKEEEHTIFEETISAPEPPVHDTSTSEPRPTPSDNSQTDNLRSDRTDLIKLLSSLILLSLIVASCSFLFWSQSVSLYESLGFAQAGLTSAGGLLISLSFAAYHGVSRSKIALICCLYSVAYEGFLVISGTQTDEAVIIDQKISSDPGITGLRARVKFTKERYDSADHRFNDPESKVFKNQWFQKTVLMPRLAAYEEASERLQARHDELREITEDDGKVYLKIAYRFGLIINIMIFAHLLAKRCYECCQMWRSEQSARGHA